MYLLWIFPTLVKRTLYVEVYIVNIYIHTCVWERE